MKKWVWIILILLMVGWHDARPINLTCIDLGRHIKNGELIVHGVWDVLYKNYYSYTFTDYPFINHHWFFGVFCYAIWHFLNFSGLSFIYILIEVLTFYVFFRRSEKIASFPIVCAFALLAIPLLATRIQIRPEGFSMLFAALFWELLNRYQEKGIKANHLKIALALMQVIWINSHLFFVLGPALVGLFWWQAKINNQKEWKDTFKQTFWIVTGACLINPSFTRGALLPFVFDFGGFRYPIAEEQSVWHMYQERPGNPIWLYFFGVLALMTLPWIAVIKKEGWKKYAVMGVAVIILSVAAIKAIRFIGVWGYFMIPVGAYAWDRWTSKWPSHLREIAVAILLMAGVIASLNVNFTWREKPYFGLYPHINNAGEYLKEENVQGPYFNNFDLAGYLIFHLSPQQRFFVDDRPEAFPDQFMKNVFIPMVARDDIWQRMDQKMNFNVIVFNHNEMARWQRRFILNRVKDPNWAVVFLDNDVIIFLKRNAQNAKLISLSKWHVIKMQSAHGEGYRVMYQ